MPAAPPVTTAVRPRKSSWFMVPPWWLVPDVRIERTTYRLQGGCSTPELIRRIGGRAYRAGRLLDDLKMRRPLRLVVGLVVAGTGAAIHFAQRLGRRLRRARCHVGLRLRTD